MIRAGKEPIWPSVYWVSHAVAIWFLILGWLFLVIVASGAATYFSGISQTASVDKRYGKSWSVISKQTGDELAAYSGLPSYLPKQLALPRSGLSVQLRFRGDVGWYEVFFESPPDCHMWDEGCRDFKSLVVELDEYIQTSPTGLVSLEENAPIGRATAQAPISRGDKLAGRSTSLGRRNLPSF